MKKTIFLAAMISAFTITATYAQDAPKDKNKQENSSGERRGPGGQRGNMYEDLNLTQEQKDKIKVLDDDQRAKGQALREDSSLGDDARREKMMELRKAKNEKLVALLTPEQKTKWEAKQKEWSNRGGGERAPKEKK